MPVIDHQEPLPQNVEPGYHTTVLHSERANTDVDPHVLKNRTQISENDTASLFKMLKYEFFLLICCSTYTLLSNVGL